MNIKLHYLYRDGANYKNANTEVFSNLLNVPLEEIRSKIEAALIEGQWFFADKRQLKDMHKFPWDNDIDNTWHEFDIVEVTREEATKGDIADWLRIIGVPK